MKHHKLRIAWSVTWGIVVVLLAALWIRSYWTMDEFFIHTQIRVSRVESNCGKLHFVTELRPALQRGEKWDENWGVWRGEALPNSILPPMPEYSAFGFSLATTGNEGPGGAVGCPHWFAIATLSLLSAFAWKPWLSYRFSLRTLLIATTLVAVGLGLMVCFVR